MSRSFPGGAATDNIATSLTAITFTGAHSIHYRLYRTVAISNGQFPRVWDKVNTDGTKENEILVGTGSQFPPFTTGDIHLLGTDAGGQFGVQQNTLNQWISGLVVYDSSSAVNVPIWYLDGVPQTVVTVSAPSGPTTGNTGAFTIGNRATDLARCLNGRVCEIAIWSALLPATAAVAMAAGASPFEAHPDNLIAYWPLLGDSPEPDYSGNRFSGTVTGTTIINHPGVQSFIPLGA